MRGVALGMTGFDFERLPSSATWVLAGDSITQGVFHTHGERSWVELVHERVRWELDRLTDLAINSGVSGWTGGQLLAQYNSFIGRFAPDVLSISFGTNDALAGAEGVADFRANLTAISERATAGGTQLILQTPVLVLLDAPERRREFLPVYAQVVRDVAAKMDATLVDHEAEWIAGLGGSQPTAWMDDHTHPNSVGHRKMAKLMLRELGLGSMDSDSLA